MGTVAILTDFGLSDPYVAMMKGVMLARAPETTFVDLTHEIPPQDILCAGILLVDAYRYFPDGTVFLAVVDPGVGSNRAILAAKAGAYYFVGPDNGLLDPVLAHCRTVEAVRIDPNHLGIDQVTATFHGRDIMAPAAAALAKGRSLETLGKPVSDWVRLDCPAALVEPSRIHGAILRADHFGNLITNIRVYDLEAAGIHLHAARITVGDRQLKGVWHTYSDVSEGHLIALLNSSGRLEIAVRDGSASEVMPLPRHAEITVDVEA